MICHRQFMLAAALLMSACATASNPEVDLAAEERAIRGRSAEIVAAENAHDYTKALTFYTADATVQAANMKQAEGHDAIRALYEEFNKMGYTSLQSTTTKVTVAASGDYAYETGVNHITFPSPKGDFVDVGKYLAVWKKVEGVWFITTLAVSSDAPPPTEAAPAN
jgi:uncharacterized protein (TIGR02246 family)